jgi:hypothetical protein
MDAATRERTSTEDFECRRRIQKLRWLGLHHEADRLAAEVPADALKVTAPLPVDYPETD